MSKWKCERCQVQVCTIELSSGYPVFCVKSKDYEPEWDEINTIIESPKQEAELPEWCKPGAWVFDYNEREYAKVGSISGDKVKLIYVGKQPEIKSKQYIIDCFFEARLRPYCSQEMKQLVGRILDNGTRMAMVTACEQYNVLARSQEVVFMVDDWYTAENLIEYGYTLNGNPCGILEFNDDGEWKED